MSGCVEFPGGFFLGAKDDAASKDGGVGVGSNSSSSSSMLARIQQMLRDQDDVVLVDLTRNLVTSASPRLPVTFKVPMGDALSMHSSLWRRSYRIPNPSITHTHIHTQNKTHPEPPLPPPPGAAGALDADAGAGGDHPGGGLRREQP